MLLQTTFWLRLHVVVDLLSKALKSKLQIAQKIAYIFVWAFHLVVIAAHHNSGKNLAFV